MPCLEETARVMIEQIQLATGKGLVVKVCGANTRRRSVALLAI
jgi:hypothetical protein